ncbi:MAG: hypothetical protein AB8H47_10910 [Bacteroidia bacterium]
MRFAGEIWRAADNGAIRFMFRTKHQRRRLGVWWRNEAPEIGLNVTGTATFNGASTTVNTGVVTDNNENEVEDFVECTNGNCDPSNAQLNGTHGGEGDDNVDRTCTITNVTLYPLYFI